jgi:multiple sugar transport system ATP-binding protein
MAKVSINHLTKYFGSFCAVSDLSLEIVEGEFMVLLGPSGCGKTTTLRAVAGLEQADQGDIFIGGVRVNRLRPAARDIAFMFQLYALYPHMTAYENIAFPLKNQGMTKGKVASEVNNVARLLRIEHLLRKKPGALSGGDMQRVALGRAMVRRPKVFLLDEPLGTLDAKLREEMRIELKRLQVESGVTTIFVTHDQAEAMSMGDRIAIMDRGKLQQVGTPREVFNKPHNLFVANFIGSPGMNLLDCRYDASGERLGLGEGNFFIPLPPEMKEIPRNNDLSGPLVLGVRPEDVSVHGEPHAEGIDVEVQVFEPLGSENIFSFKKGNVSLLARTKSSFIRKAGDRAWILFIASRVHIFDKTTGKAFV